MLRLLVFKNSLLSSSYLSFSFNSLASSLLANMAADISLEQIKNETVDLVSNAIPLEYHF